MARAIAGHRFVDADAALVLVGDLAGYVGGGAIDTAELQQRLDQLATDKPHLLKPTHPQGFTPNRVQATGSGITAPPPKRTPTQSIAHKQRNKALDRQDLTNLAAQLGL